MLDSNGDLQALISSFAADLEAAVRRDLVKRIQEAIGGGGGEVPTPFTVKRGPGRPRGSMVKRARAAKGEKRSPEQMEAMTGELVAYVKANPGQRGEQIAAALKTDVKTMRLPMLKLIEAKAISTKGQRRGMTYYPGGGGGSGGGGGNRKPRKARAAKK